MREIKFRAWDNRFKSMDFGSGDLLLRISKPDFTEPMQYTGIKDKNGVEIFENDVCIHKQVAGGLLEPAPAKNVQIVWTELHNGWICDDGKYQYSMQTSQLEIIGNIHENPELLN